MRDLFQRLRFYLSYFGKPPWDSGISPPELFEFIEEHPAGRAIDLGCGTGTNVVTLAKAGWQVTGIDFIPRAIRVAIRKVQDARVQVVLNVDDVMHLKTVNSTFDLALDLGCFHGVADRRKYLDQLDRILAPNGFWLMYGFFKPDPHQPGPGLAEADLDLISSRLTLISRRDGFDKRERSSAWFLFQK